MGSKAVGGKKSGSRSRSFVDPNQVPFLDDIRSQGQALANSQSQVIGDVASQLTGALGGVGGGLLGGLEQQSQSFAPGAGSSIANLLQTGAGQDPLSGGIVNTAGQLAGIGGDATTQALLGPGAQLGGQLSALDQAIQRNLASTLGTIGGQATLAGGTGGDRQAFFSSEAGGEAQRSFAAGAADLFGQDLAARRGVAGQVLGVQAGAVQGAGGLLSQLLGQQTGASQAAGQLGLQQQGQNIGAAQAGLGSLEGLFNLGLAPFQAQFQPLLNQAQIVGDPTVLQTQRQKSREFDTRGSFFTS